MCSQGSDLLMVEEAKDMLRDILTMCGQEPHKKQLAKEREKAQVRRTALLHMNDIRYFPNGND